MGEGVHGTAIPGKARGYQFAHTRTRSSREAQRSEKKWGREREGEGVREKTVMAAAVAVATWSRCMGERPNENGRRVATRHAHIYMCVCVHAPTAGLAGQSAMEVEEGVVVVRGVVYCVLF